MADSVIRPGAPSVSEHGTVHVAHLTGATRGQRPSVCQGCVWWQSRPAGRPVDGARWTEDMEDRFGAWGKLYLEGDRHVASLQYGPAAAFPRARFLPAGPPSDDAVLVTCAYLSDPSSPWALQSLFLACMGECRDRSLPAIEAFAHRPAPEEGPAERFLEHRTIFPRDFLGDLGFRTLRSAGAVELMRVELTGLVPVEEPLALLAEAWHRVKGLVSRPAPAGLPTP